MISQLSSNNGNTNDRVNGAVILAYSHCGSLMLFV